MEFDARKMLQESTYLAVGVGVVGTKAAARQGSATRARLTDTAKDLRQRGKPRVTDAQNRIERWADSLTKDAPPQIRRALGLPRDGVGTGRSNDPEDT